jgi:enediyne polyketide synthase
LLRAVDSTSLKLLVTFGSIIGRIGMDGEADYALANEWLRSITKDFGQKHQSCTAVCIEWSVWSGAGMGERLGRVDTLRRAGVTPIPADTGTAILHEILSAPPKDHSVIVAGRFGMPPTAQFVSSDLPLLRFLEKPQVHYLGVELVVDSQVSVETDPYLDDHRLDGDRLFPAVMGLEAMAQAVSALVDFERTPAFEDINFNQPIIIPETDPATLRIVVQVNTDGTLDAVLRCSTTDYQVDHFTCKLRFDFDTTDGRPASFPVVKEISAHSPAADELYDNLLFHRGRFKRVCGYHLLHAKKCVARLQHDSEQSWFGRYHPAELLLGDPGTRDAAIHAIQGCVPEKTIIPTGVDSIRMYGKLQNDTVLVHADEIRNDGDLYIYDLMIATPEGEVIESWKGLQLRAIKQSGIDTTWPVRLLGPYLERMYATATGANGIKVALDKSRDKQSIHQSEEILKNLVGPNVCLTWDSDGRPLTDNGLHVSSSDTGAIVMAVSAGVETGCDIEPVRKRSRDDWRSLLGPKRLALAVRLSQEYDIDTDAAATIIWSVRESVIKASGSHELPLVFRSGIANDLLSFSAGSYDIVSGTVVVQDQKLPLAVAAAFRKR